MADPTTVTPRTPTTTPLDIPETTPRLTQTAEVATPVGTTTKPLAVLAYNDGVSARRLDPTAARVVENRSTLGALQRTDMASATTPGTTPRARLEASIAEDDEKLSDPANAMPVLREGQGIVRVDGPGNQRLEYSIERIDGDTITLRDRIASQGATRTMTRAELARLVLDPDPRSPNARVEVRQEANITSPRVLSEAERITIQRNEKANVLAMMNLERDIRTRNTEVFGLLVQRRAALVENRIGLNNELRAYLATRGPKISEFFSGLANGQPPPTAIPEDFEARERILRNDRSIAEIDRALEQVRVGKTVDFVPEHDGGTRAIVEFQRSGANQPSLALQTQHIAGQTLGAIETARNLSGRLVDSHVLTARVGYVDVIQANNNVKNAAGESINRNPDGSLSLVAALNATLMQKEGANNGRLVTSAAQLQTPEMQRFIRDNWSGILVNQGPSLMGPNGVPFDTRAQQMLALETTRLARLETDPERVALADSVRAVQEYAPQIEALRPGLGERTKRFLKDTADSPVTWGLVALTVATEGMGTALLGSGELATAAVATRLAAGAARVGVTIPEATLSSVARAGVFGARIGIDGVALQTGMNLLNGTIGNPEAVSWKPGDFARSIALAGIGRYAVAAHRARAAAMQPGLTRQFGEQLRYFGEESIGMGLVTGVDVALRSRSPEEAMRELETNAQMMLAMRTGFGIVGGVRRAFGVRGTPPPADDPPAKAVTDTTATVEGMLRTNVDPSSPQFRAAMKDLGHAYDNALAAYSPAEAAPTPARSRRPRAIAANTPRPPTIRGPLLDPETGKPVTSTPETTGPRMRENPVQQAQANNGRVNPRVKALIDELDNPLLRDDPAVQSASRKLAGRGFTEAQLSSIEDIRFAVEELNLGRPELSRAVAARLDEALPPANQRQTPQSAAELESVLRDVAQRTVNINERAHDATGPFRSGLSQQELASRARAALDPSRPFDTTVAGFRARPDYEAIPPTVAPDKEAALALENAADRQTRSTALNDYEHNPLPVQPGWYSHQGDKLVRDKTNEFSPLLYADINTARPQAAHFDAAGRSTFRLDPTNRGIQSFEPTTVSGVPPFTVDMVTPRGLDPRKPTFIWASEAIPPPFDAHGKPTGAIQEILGPNLDRLGDVNVVLVRTPFQGDGLRAGNFTASVDNQMAALAATTSAVDNVITQLREGARGLNNPPKIGFFGYSAGGSLVNQYRGQFDSGRPGQGADMYGPNAAPAQGYGGLFDPANNNGKHTWLGAITAPAALHRQQDIARLLSGNPQNLAASLNKVYALVPELDDFVPGVRRGYDNRYGVLRNVAHTSPVLTPLVPTTTGELFNTPAPFDRIPVQWPAGGSVSSTAADIRTVWNQFLREEPVGIGRDRVRLPSTKP